MSDKLKVENQGMHRVPLKHIGAMRHHKKQGWWPALQRAGIIVGKGHPEASLEVPYVVWATLLDKYNPHLRKRRPGLGDAVHAVIKLFFALPIARRFRPKCFDARGQLKPNSRCGRRQAKLNKIHL